MAHPPEFAKQLKQVEQLVELAAIAALAAFLLGVAAGILLGSAFNV